MRDGGFLNYEMLVEYLMMGNCAKEMADISCLLNVRLENHLFFCFSTCCTQSAAVFGGKPADFNQVACNSVTILGGTSLLYLCLTMC